MATFPTPSQSSAEVEAEASAPSPALSLPLPSNIGWPLAITLGVSLHVSLAFVAIMVQRWMSIEISGPNWLFLVMRGTDPWTQFLSGWQRWDALWYQEIAEHGYGATNGTAAFYPLYPFLSRAVSVPLFGHTVIAELLVSGVASVTAFWLIYRLARLDVQPLVAALAVLLTALFPVGFFLMAPYTEGLFLLMTVSSIWFARTNRPWLAGLAGLGAGLTRLQGAFLLPALVLEYLRQRNDRGERPGVALLPAFLPALGPLVFTLAQSWLIHVPHPGLGAQNMWGYQVVMPWQALAKSWHYISSHGDPIEAFNLICLLGFSLLAVGVTVRLSLTYALYIWPSIGLLFTRVEFYSPLLSVSRFMLVLFPCFIFLAMVLAKRPWAAFGIILGSTVLQTMLFAYWVHWGFVA